MWQSSLHGALGCSRGHGWCGRWHWSLLIGEIGAVLVVKAIYVDRPELRCACMGGGSNVPLGAISLTETVIVVAMALWMMAKAVA